MAKLIGSDDNFMHLKRVDDDVKMSIADNELKALCQKACEEIIPLQVNAKEGFKRMLGEAKAIRFKEV